MSKNLDVQEQTESSTEMYLSIAMQQQEIGISIKVIAPTMIGVAVRLMLESYSSEEIKKELMKVAQSIETLKNIDDSENETKH